MIQEHFTVRLPDWVRGFAASLPAQLEGDEARMEVAIRLAEENVRQGTGGPFGALVVAEVSGRIVSLGVNRVEPTPCSSAHAEIVALSLAQAALKVHDLSAELSGEDHSGLAGGMTLVTSCEPCAMCLGAIPWSGVSSVLCGADKADAEAAGFDEGDRSADWMGMLERRGVRARTGILRSRAAAVFRRYAEQGGNIY